MGRKVHGPRPGLSREYIPEAFNNRDDLEPITVTINDPTEGEKRRFALMQTELGYENGEVVREADGSPRIHITLDSMAKFQKAAISKHVERIENYEVRGIKIKNAQRLLEHGETELIAEIALEVTTGFSLSETEKKPVGELSASKRAESPPSNGTAENVRNGECHSSVTATEDRTRLSYT